MKKLAGKITVVTNASRGAGRGIALVLGEAGATVYVTGRSVREVSSRPEVNVDPHPKEYEQTESVECIGRAVVALASDPNFGHHYLSKSTDMLPDSDREKIVYRLREVFKREVENV
jgi:NAD(P)-dependent dehydrogenase (short-subunit alcohol dehydrogenase family)